MISLKVFWLERKKHQGNYIQHNLVTLNIGNFSTNCLWKEKAKLWANTNKQKLSWFCSDNHNRCLLFAHSFTCLHWLRVWNRLHQKWFRKEYNIRQLIASLTNWIINRHSMPKFHRLNLNVRIEVVPKVVEREMITTITLLV